MSMCPPCSRAWMAWLDYRLPPPPIRLISIGSDWREVKWRQEARYREWRDTVRWQQDLIRRLCREEGHAGTLEEPRPVDRVPVAGGVL